MATSILPTTPIGKGTSLDDPRCTPKANGQSGRTLFWNMGSSKSRSPATTPKSLFRGAPSSAPVTPAKEAEERGNVRLPPASAPVTPQKESSKKKLCCDACDGEHLTSDCPYYKKKREDHPDGRKGLGPKGLGSTSGNFTLKTATVVRQPPDGSCLFHSMAQGLPSPAISAATLRKKIATWIADHPQVVIAESPLRDWVKWDTNKSVAAYAMRMSRAGVWGGGIEMAACSIMYGVNIWVYEVEEDGDEDEGPFKRISCFNSPDAQVSRGGGRTARASSTTTIHVLYGGGVHFDALRPAPGTLLPSPELPKRRQSKKLAAQEDDEGGEGSGEDEEVKGDDDYEEPSRFGRSQDDRRSLGGRSGVAGSVRSNSSSVAEALGNSSSRARAPPPSSGVRRPSGSVSTGPALRQGTSLPSYSSSASSRDGSAAGGDRSRVSTPTKLPPSSSLLGGGPAVRRSSGYGRTTPEGPYRSPTKPSPQSNRIKPTRQGLSTPPRRTTQSEIYL